MLEVKPTYISFIQGMSVLHWLGVKTPPLCIQIPIYASNLFIGSKIALLLFNKILPVTNHQHFTLLNT